MVVLRFDFKETEGDFATSSFVASVKFLEAKKISDLKHVTRLNCTYLGRTLEVINGETESRGSIC
jgi:hypothetical protein